MGWDEDIRARYPNWGTGAAIARWPEIRAQICVGQHVCGAVIARAPFGVWLDINIGHPALLLVPEMRGAKELRMTFEDYPDMGEIVEARIVAVEERGEISITQHPETESRLVAGG